LEPDEAVDEGADKIRESVKEEREQRELEERFRVRAAIVIAVLAALLAVASLGRDEATREMITANILASDTWTYYQAKASRQTSIQLAADALRAQIAIQGSALMPGDRQALQKTVDDYQAAIALYESDPKTGEGKRELSDKARQLEADRDRAQSRSPSFDYSVTLFHIAIVLGSVSIVAVSRRVLAATVAAGALATLLLINGFLLPIPLR
jgi:Domain of unknown function (DUF4337)